MKFGDYLKNQRDRLGWNQPEAAAKAGIEQSYLSKLETGKSCPSDEIFARLVEAYDIDVEQMTREVSPAELARLKDISRIRAVVTQQKADKVRASRAWLVAALACLVLAGGAFGLQLLPGELGREYRYRSAGILLPGEALTAFNIAEAEIEPIPENAGQLARQRALMDRLDQDDQVLAAYKGTYFVEDVDDGRRVYELYDDREVETRPATAIFLVPGMMLLMAGIGAFIISFRWN